MCSCKSYFKTSAFCWLFTVCYVIKTSWTYQKYIHLIGLQICHDFQFYYSRPIRFLPPCYKWCILYLNLWLQFTLEYCYLLICCWFHAVIINVWYFSFFLMFWVYRYSIYYILNVCLAFYQLCIKMNVHQIVHQHLLPWKIMIKL